MATDLVRGAYSGKETKLYYNSATHASPTYVEIKNARNIQITEGPGLAEVETHGAGSIGNIPGYQKFSGSFEYVKKRGTDAVYDFLVAARKAGNIVCIRHSDQDHTTTGAKYTDAPILLGEGTSTANGGDPVNDSFAFGKADAYDSSGNAVEVTTGTTA